MSQKSKGVYVSARFRARIMERLASPPFSMKLADIGRVFGFTSSSAVSNAIRRHRRRQW